MHRRLSLYSSTRARSALLSGSTAPPRTAVLLAEPPAASAVDSARRRPRRRPHSAIGSATAGTAAARSPRGLPAASTPADAPQECWLAWPNRSSSPSRQYRHPPRQYQPPGDELVQCPHGLVSISAPGASSPERTWSVKASATSQSRCARASNRRQRPCPTRACSPATVPQIAGRRRPTPHPHHSPGPGIELPDALYEAPHGGVANFILVAGDEGDRGLQVDMLPVRVQIAMLRALQLALLTVEGVEGLVPFQVKPPARRTSASR